MKGALVVEETCEIFIGTKTNRAAENREKRGKKRKRRKKNCKPLILLTSTLIPGIGNTLVGGISLGENRQNSCLPRYHLTEYKGAPSKSYWHNRDTCLPLCTEVGFADKVTFDRQPQPSVKYKNETKFIPIRNFFFKGKKSYFNPIIELLNLQISHTILKRLISTRKSLLTFLILIIN